MSTISVLDSNGTPVTVQAPLAPGAAAAAASRPVVLASDDPLVTAFGAKTDAADTHTDGTSISGVSIWKQISKTLQAAASAQATAANQAAPNDATLSNPTSQLSLTSTTTAYGVGQLVANNGTAGSVTVPSVTIPNSKTGAKISGGRLLSDDPLSTAWGGQSVQIDLWSAAPTFTNGDRGAYAVATGAANYLGTLIGTFEPAMGDGAAGRLVPKYGDAIRPKLGASSVFWSVQTLTGSGVVTGTGPKHFTFVPELES